MIDAIRVFVFLVGKIVKDINRWVSQWLLPTMAEAPPERVAFLRVQVYERVGIPWVALYERVGKSVILFYKKSLKGLSDAYYGCEKV